MEADAAQLLAAELSAIQQNIHENGEESIRTAARAIFEKYGTLRENAVSLDACYDNLPTNSPLLFVLQSEGKGMT